VAPTLVVNPDAKLRLTREEVFGPVVNLVRVADGEEALQLANDTEYGLTASVWTQNLSQALRFQQSIQDDKISFTIQTDHSEKYSML
ncbi:aldehyde dehydrogenase family protein, partial [Escherichia coli]|nr:aldehyde dehydrogenase family protein [Escherichia coli]